MSEFIIDRDAEKIQSINRTIRIKSDTFDRLMELSEQNGISFNKLVNQCLEYALANLKQEDS